MRLLQRFASVFGWLEPVILIVAICGCGYLLLGFYQQNVQVTLFVDYPSYKGPLVAPAMAAMMFVAIVWAMVLVVVAASLRISGRLSRALSWAILVPAIGGLAGMAWTGMMQGKYMTRQVSQDVLSLQRGPADGPGDLDSSQRWQILPLGAIVEHPGS